MRNQAITATEKQVSELFGWAVSTLRNWRCLGKGPPYLKVGRSVRYRLEDVEAYLDSHRVEPRNEPGN